MAITPSEAARGGQPDREPILSAAQEAKFNRLEAKIDQLLSQGKREFALAEDLQLSDHKGDKAIVNMIKWKFMQSGWSVQDKDVVTGLDLRQEENYGDGLLFAPIPAK